MEGQRHTSPLSGRWPSGTVQVSHAKAPAFCGQRAANRGSLPAVLQRFVVGGSRRYEHLRGGARVAFHLVHRPRIRRRHQDPFAHTAPRRAVRWRAHSRHHHCSRLCWCGHSLGDARGGQVPVHTPLHVLGPTRPEGWRGFRPGWHEQRHRSCAYGSARFPIIDAVTPRVVPWRRRVQLARCGLGAQRRWDGEGPAAPHGSARTRHA
mmetsp:Transcript_25566/g.82486  ORF Transcript_25566/g.82486 Transcript_25566/m.82486 type:complete len:207 (-) Transcript_25566:1181-1801(-)